MDLGDGLDQGIAVSVAMQIWVPLPEFSHTIPKIFKAGVVYSKILRDRHDKSGEGAGFTLVQLSSKS